MTTLTTSGIGRRPDDDGLEPLAGLRVEPAAGPAGDRRLGSRPRISVRAAASGAGRRRSRRSASAVEAGRAEDGEDDRALGAERPGPAGEADLVDARAVASDPRFVGVQFRPESSVSGARSAVASSGRAPRDPGRRPAREPSVVHGAGRVERRRRPPPQAASATSERRRAGANAGSRASREHGRQRSRRAPRCAPAAARGASVAPGTGVPVRCAACARPSTPAERDEGAIALADGRGVPFRLRRPAIEPGDTWGVGHGTGNGHSCRGGSGREIPDPDHEPSNWTSANRPGGPSGRQRLSLELHPRHRSPSGIGGRSRVSGGRAVGRVRRSGRGRVAASGAPAGRSRADRDRPG